MTFLIIHNIILISGYISRTNYYSYDKGFEISARFTAISRVYLYRHLVWNTVTASPSVNITIIQILRAPIASAVRTETDRIPSPSIIRPWHKCNRAYNCCVRPGPQYGRKRNDYALEDEKNKKITKWLNVFKSTSVYVLFRITHACAWVRITYIILSSSNISVLVCRIREINSSCRTRIILYITYYILAHTHKHSLDMIN